MGSEQAPKSKKKPAPKPDFSLVTDLHKLGYQKIVGLDEVGRGAIAGPIVVAAVELPISIDGITDSKLVSKQKRRGLFTSITSNAQQIKLGLALNTEIDQLGITKAQELAYKRALENIQADLLLTDFYTPPSVHKFIKSMKGDQLFYSVAAASIVAKVYRDQLMHLYHHFHPQYDWLNNVGYGTNTHIQSVETYGQTPLHRLSFIKNRLSLHTQPSLEGRWGKLR